MSRVYVDNPASVPPRYEPQRGAGGGWYYETETEDDDGILQELIQLISEQILPGMDEESLTEDLLIEEVEQELSERAEQYKGEIRKAVDSIMTEKLSMDRVYVGDESQVPEGYQAMRDDAGDMYYVRTDDQFIDSGRETTSYDFDKQEEVTEGLTWNEHVMVVDVDREEGMATLVDTEGSSEWEESLESVEAKLAQLEANRDHEWMYELVAGEYPELSAEDVMEMVHDAAGVDKGVRPDWEERLDKDEDPCWEGYTMVGLKDNGNPRCVPDDDVENYDADKSEKSRVYVSDESEVPAAYTPQHGLHGGVYYETEPQESQSIGERAQVTVDDFFGGAGDMAEDIVDALMDFIPLDRDTTDHLTDEDRQRMHEVADRAAQQQFDLLENSFTSVILNELSKRDLSQDEFVGAIMELNKAVTGFVGGIEKSRTYVSSPEEVPEGYEVQEGGRGGYYYETGSGSGMSAEGIDDMSEDELEEFRDYLMDQHQAAREAREGRGGRGTDTMEDELMRDIMDVVMDVDTELMDRDGI